MPEFKNDFPKTYGWLNEEIQLQEVIGTVSSAAGLVLNGILLVGSVWFSWRKLRGWFDDNFRKCGTFRVGKDRKACHKNLQIQYWQKRIELLKKNNCEKANNPEKCKTLVRTNIDKYNTKIDKAKATLRRLNLPGEYNK